MQNKTNNVILGKRILLFVPSFYGYDTIVKNAFEQAGAIVDCFSMEYSDRNWNKKKLKAVEKYLLKSRAEFINKKKKRLSKIKEFCLSSFYDYFFVIQIYPFDSEFISNLKKINPSIKTFIYLWDSFDTYNLMQEASYFDVIYSFNRKDVESLKSYNFTNAEKIIKYLPNFYIADEGSNSISNDELYDISFVGTVNFDTLERCQFLKRLETWCKDNKLKSYLYLRYHTNYLVTHSIKSIIRYCVKKSYRKYNNCLYSYLNKKSISFLQKGVLSLKDVGKIEYSSKCILDIAHIKRQGYTINAITAIAKGKKLVTTNAFIEKEPFYHPNNIYIVDVFNPIFDKDFFLTSTYPIDLSCLEVKNWIFMVIDEDYYSLNITKVSYN